MHSNSILLCFCSLLCYENLSDHIHHYKAERKLFKSENKSFKIKEFDGLNNRIKTRTYNQKILNKWCLLIVLNNNPSLIRCRKHNLKKIKPK